MSVNAPLEAVVDPVTRNFTNATPITSLHKDLASATYLPDWILLNLSTWDQNWQKDLINEAIKTAKDFNIPLYILSREQEITSLKQNILLPTKTFNILSANTDISNPIWLTYTDSSKLDKIYNIISTNKSQAYDMYTSEVKANKWKCPFCSTLGTPTNQHYGICDKCNIITTAQSYQDTSRDPLINRHIFTLHFGKAAHPTPPKIFFTDASGLNINNNQIKKTGWGAVQTTGQGKIDSNIKIINKYMGTSKNLKSIVWCEAKGILTALQKIREEENAIIHTDSKVTMLHVKNMLTKPYSKTKKLKNKSITQEIIEELSRIKGKIILEWVKAHEDADSYNNYIHKYKSEGNQLADETAKEAVTAPQGQILEEVEKYEYTHVITNQRSNIQVPWQGLNKHTKLWLEAERNNRLRHSTHPNFVYGQGVYNLRAHTNRSITSKAYAKSNIEGIVKTMLFNYNTNRIMTRETLYRTHREAGRRHTNITSSICPLCALAEVGTVIQTKEHIFSGQCIGTKDIILNTIIQNTLTPLGFTLTISERINTIIQRELGKISTQEHSISNHTLSPNLLGFWSNDIVLSITEILQEQVDREKAIDIALKISNSYIQRAKEIYLRFLQHYELFTSDLNATEILWITNHTGTIPERLTTIKQARWTITNTRTAKLTNKHEVNTLISLTNKKVHLKLGFKLTKDISISTADFQETLTKLGYPSGEIQFRWHKEVSITHRWLHEATTLLRKILLTKDNHLRPYVQTRGLTQVIEELCRKQIGSSKDIAKGLANLEKDDKVNWNNQNPLTAISIANALYASAIQNLPLTLQRVIKG